ncbi:MAG: DUF739 family protein [Oenococcus oeni]
MYDYSELKGLLAKNNSNMSKLAKQLNVSKPTIYKRFAGKYDWDTNQINKICKLYGIEKNEIPKYFFSENVKQELTFQPA